MVLSKQGFTLAELLAVVVIIGLMTSFGVGYYKKSVAQAHFSNNIAIANRQVEKAAQDRLDAQLQGLYHPTSADPSPYCYVVSYSDPNYPNYDIEVTPECVPYNFDATTFARGRVACIGKTEDGKAFCESMGYRTCVESADDASTLSSGAWVCTQPAYTH